MISFFEATLRTLSVHRLGNKINDEFYVLSEKELDLTEDQSAHFMQYFLSPFQKVNDVFSLYHPSGDLNLNEVYATVDSLFPFYRDNFHESTKDLTKLLYEVSNHPKIKSGELYVAFFENVQYQGETHNAIGIFKSENKETYLKVNPVQTGFNVKFENEAVNISNLDKGCLILNVDAEDGFKVICLDEKGKDSGYWRDEFLGLKVVNDDFQKTSNLMGLVKSFVNDKLEEDFDLSKANKIDLLNKATEYFKTNEVFDIEQFSHEVIANDQAISSFKEYKSIYEEDFDTNIPDDFNISDPAVKKHSKSFKNVIKLDKNFQIHIHGKKELIEKGFDQEKAMNYYKVFYKEES